jgi:hypothetical protein
MYAGIASKLHLKPAKKSILGQFQEGYCLPFLVCFFFHLHQLLYSYRNSRIIANFRLKKKYQINLLSPIKRENKDVKHQF